jgi:short-subunit dehydrogenase
LGDDASPRGVTVDDRLVQVDLAEPQGVDSLYDRIRVVGRPVDAAALNAGSGAGGAFVGERACRTSFRSST